MDDDEARTLLRDERRLVEELLDLSDCVMRCAKRPFGGVAILSESGAYKALALSVAGWLALLRPTIWRLDPGLLLIAAAVYSAMLLVGRVKFGQVSTLPSIDFVMAAKAHGWDGFRVKPDLSNLKEIIDACYETRGQSIVVDVPVDADQVIGLNPRLYNLTTKTYL